MSFKSYLMRIEIGLKLSSILFTIFLILCFLLTSPILILFSIYQKIIEIFINFKYKDFSKLLSPLSHGFATHQNINKETCFNIIYKIELKYSEENLDENIENLK